MREEVLAFLLGSFATFLFGIVVLVASRLVSSPRHSSRNDALQNVLTVVGWVLIAMGLAGSLLLFTPVVFLTPVGIILPIIAVFLLLEILVKRKVTQQYSLLWVMATAAERFIPLTRAIEAFGRERGGAFAHRARRLAEMLTAGATLPEALRLIPGLVPAEALPIIHVGYESGALAAALRQAACGREHRGQFWFAILGKVVYLLGLLAVGMVIVTGVMVWIVPAFIKIFADFEIELPAMTVTLISVANFTILFWFLFWPVFLAAWLLFFYAIGRYSGWIRWDLPGTGYLVRRLDSAAILEALALAAEHQRPMGEAIANLAQSYPKAPIRRRLAKVLSDLKRGTDWCESLLAQGLIKRADLAILQAAQRVGNLPWALGEMADSNRRRLVYRLQALVQLLFPPLLLLIGTLVMFFVVSLFLPLIALIQGLS